MAGVKRFTLGILLSVALGSAARADALIQSSAFDAFINLGTGPYLDPSMITAGNAQPWYDSAQIARLFGGQPTAQQQADFDNTVLQRVQQTFNLSGVPVTLTDNPSVSAAHTLSVVSNSSSRIVPNALGMTQEGGNGFSFIDHAATSAQSLDQLEWLVAHNVSHELMVAFGVGENYDKTGNYIDAPVANWAMMIDPKATFSQAAAQALLAQNLTDSVSPVSLQIESPQTVPEPTTVALWSSIVTSLVALRRKRSRRRAA